MAQPAPWYNETFAGVAAPRTPNWNLSAPDHHWLVREQAPLTEQCIYSSDHLYQNRLR